jgi:hypothetical protein
MKKTEFRIPNFEEFMYTLRDFNESLHEWESENISNTWDLECSIGENEYIIYLTIDESKDKSK